MIQLPLVGLAILCAVTTALAQSRDVLQTCLSAGEKREACASYLADLMRDVRFGTPIARPFCIPKRDLTGEELHLVLTKFWAANPDLEEYMARILATVLTVKSAKCP